MRLMTLLMVCSCACSTIPRPDTNLCVVNVPGKHLKCYNLKRDYDGDGNRNPDAKPTIVPISSLNDLNKFIATDPDGFANLKAYVQKIREEYNNKCPIQ